MSHPYKTSRLLFPSVVAALAALTFAGCTEGPDGQNEAAETSAEDQGDDSSDIEPALATAELTDPDGESLGQIEFLETEGGVEIVAATENMEPGFYGFHIHEIGECEPDSAAPDDPEDTGDFMSAGSHIVGDEDADHPDHAGDLPVLLVNEDGTAQQSVVTDRLDESLLLDDDGSAVMIHADADNFGNVPERYLGDGSTPDDDTLGTGDAGDRLACGVVEG